MEFYNSYIRTARKSHTCEYCQKEIEAGEKYSYESGKFEGDFFTRTLCIPCLKMLNAYVRRRNDKTDDTFDWWQVSDYLTENYCDELCFVGKWHDCDKSPQCCEKVRNAILERYK